ncbi:MAG TPA: hypothetical protein VI078_02225 [bacterium]
MKRSFLLAAAALAGALLLRALPASASGGYLTQFEGTYPAAKGSRIDTCTLCHTGVPSPRNAYGAAFAAAGHSFTAINGADSDGDGFTNLAEITALTFPGDAADHPAPPDATPPTVDAFSLPADSTSLTVNILAFTASDNVGVTGYLLTPDATAPAANATGWSATAPQTYTFAAVGTWTLYAWAKDAAGNVSTSRSASVVVTDTTPPPPPPPPPPPTGQLFFSDFSDATWAGAPGWDRIAGRFGGDHGTFVNFADGRNVSLADDAIAGLAPFAGGRIVTKFRFVRPQPGARADVLFDYVDGRNFRYVRFARDIGRVIIGQTGTVGGRGASVLSLRVPKLFAKSGVWHEVQVDVDPVANTVKVFVDNGAQPVLTRTYPATGIGRVGVAGFGARRTIGFDNFEVSDTTVLP